MMTLLPNRQRLAPSVAAALGAVVALTACSAGDLESPSADSDRDRDRQTSRQALGESTQAYTFDGPGSRTIPSYSERVAHHLVNRMRLDPGAFELENMNGETLPAEIPALLDPGLIEVGRWQGQHAIEYNCYCPKDPMEDGTYNSCCTMEKRNGQVQCVSGRVDCETEQATEEEDRWDLLQSGNTNVRSETYIDTEMQRSEAPPALPGESLATNLQGSPGVFLGTDVFGIAQVAEPKPPEECRAPSEPCAQGRCIDPLTGANTCDPDEDDDCQGLCWGGSCDGVCEADGEEGEEAQAVECELPASPDASSCDSSEWPIGYYVSFLQGGSAEPLPTLVDGIHMKLGLGEDPLFGQTPDAAIDFQIHYFDPGGDARRSNLVAGGECHDLQVQKRAGTPAGGPVDDGDATGDTASPPSQDGAAMDDAGSDSSEYFGHRYGKAVELDPGCHRYVFSFTDADGFIHTYPSYGSLGAAVVEQDDGEGNTVVLPAVNDESCPLWSSERPETSCLPEGDQCVSGETRPCYTGRANTRGKGICSIGTESCENGRWSGVCEGETTPEAEETCGDDLDNNCNGEVDEGCGEGDGPVVGEDTGTGNESDTGTGGGDEDAGDNQTPGDDGGMSEPDGSGEDPGTEADAGGDTEVIIGGSGDGGGDDSGCGGCSAGGEGLPPATPSFLVMLAGVVYLRRKHR